MLADVETIASCPAGGSAATSAPLSTVLAELVTGAARALERDRELARRLLDRAQALLQLQLDGAEPASANAQSIGALPAWRARRVVRYVDENLDRSLSLRELADAVGLSARHFSRAFKLSLGEPPGAFVLRRRVERAQLAMLHGEEPLAQIALACGFADQTHMTRAFRRMVGQAPGKWRRTNCPRRERRPPPRRITTWAA